MCDGRAQFIIPSVNDNVFFVLFFILSSFNTGYGTDYSRGS